MCVWTHVLKFHQQLNFAKVSSYIKPTMYGIIFHFFPLFSNILWFSLQTGYVVIDSPVCSLNVVVVVSVAKKGTLTAIYGNIVVIGHNSIWIETFWSRLVKNYCPLAFNKLRHTIFPESTENTNIICSLGFLISRLGPS